MRPVRSGPPTAAGRRIDAATGAADDAAWDAGLLTLIRYVDLDDPEWVARQTAAAGELLELPDRHVRRMVARRQWRSHAQAELLAGLATGQLDRSERASELARLACTAAAAVSPSALTAADDLRSRSLLVLARTLRHLGMHQDAERALAGAARRFHDPEQPGEVGFYLAEVGKLRWEEGRLDEAAACFAQALTVVGERRRGSVLRGGLHLLAGHLCLDLGQFDRAGELLAGFDLDADRFPVLWRRARLATELCFAAGGRRSELPMGNGSDAAPGMLDPEGVWQDWMCGRIAAAASHLTVAQRALDAVRRRLLAVGSLREAAAASLDLAMARRAARRPAGFGRLGRDLAVAFPAVSAAVVAAFGACGDGAIGTAELDRRAAVMRRRLAAMPRRRRGRADHIPHLARLVDRAGAGAAGRRLASKGSVPEEPTADGMDEARRETEE